MKITENDFWKLVDEIGWPCDCEKAKIELMRRFTPAEIKKYRDVMDDLWKCMDQFIGDRNPSNGGDDSYGDLIYHVIGLGKTEYYKSLKDYSRLEKRGQKSDYMECFSYCFPYDFDYDDMTLPNIIKFAKMGYVYYKNFLNLDTNQIKFLPVDIVMKLTKLIEVFSTGTSGNIDQYKTLLKNKQQFIKYSEEIKTYIHSNKMELPRKFTDGNNIFEYCLIENFLSDLEKYLRYTKQI